ncbi:Methyltransferase domain-containing protein [Treponema bryantii]|uniref:Methyltransferase domain-containing protein n=1 Tax=Treponema bryantii TaxID=163 RepID=A0A1H9DHE4_9SPIR|nr:class I SAM-dependent methyltransferase [Treponema bryantii]SEQ12900.1 Methyltransferase domain-containing protein [Treponema bryantii]
MTDFEKVKNYYKHFDEKNRLRNDNSGKLEFLMTMRILEKNLPALDDGAKISVLDLGGGAGVYSFPLAKKGYKVTLADLSETLLEQAKKQKEEDKVENLISCDQVNATDLSCYKDNSFDVVLLFGPLYHLTEKDEREKCVAEIQRVLKTGGKVFASFIPHLAGSIALVQRFCWSPDQVSIDTLEDCFDSGKFKNLSSNGFQEGYYPTSEEIENLFIANGFEKQELRSIRGFGYEKEDVIFKFKNKNVFSKILELIDSTSEEKSIIEMCGHAMYVGVKK